MFVLGGMVLPSIGTVPLTFIDDNKASIMVENDIDEEWLTYNFILFLAEPSSIIIIGLLHHIQHIMSPYPSGKDSQGLVKEG